MYVCLCVHTCMCTHIARSFCGGQRIAFCCLFSFFTVSSGNDSGCPSYIAYTCSQWAILPMFSFLFSFGLRSYTITVQVIKLTPKCAVLLEIAIWPVRSSLDRCSSIGWETVKGESGIENWNKEWNGDHIGKRKWMRLNKVWVFYCIN